MKHVLIRSPLPFLLLVVLAQLCPPAVRCASATDAPARPVAVVAGTPISAPDIACKIKTEAAYGNQGVSPGAALIALINSTLEQAVARRHGVRVTIAEIDSFGEYVDQHTKSPAILRQVKQVFAGNRVAYEQLFLVPKIMNRKLRYFYSRDPSLHRRERRVIEQAYSLVAAGRSFPEAAKEVGLTVHTIDFAEGGRAVPTATRGASTAVTVPAPDRLRKILAPLAAGETYQGIIEDDEAYTIIRLRERRGAIWTTETICAVKRPFAAWFAEEAATVKIEIIDPVLKSDIRGNYPLVGWVKQVGP